MSSMDGANPSGRDRASSGGVQVLNEGRLIRLMVGAVGLLRCRCGQRSRLGDRCRCREGKGYFPESVEGITLALEDGVHAFVDSYSLGIEGGRAAMVAKHADGQEWFPHVLEEVGCLCGER